MEFVSINGPDDFTDEIEEIIELSYLCLFASDAISSGSKIDWHALIDRLEDYTLSDGRHMDFGVDMNSSGVKELKKRVRQIRKESQ